MNNTLSFTITSNKLDIQDFRTFLKQNPSELKPTCKEIKNSKEGKSFTEEVIRFAIENPLGASITGAVVANYLIKLIDWVFEKANRGMKSVIERVLQNQPTQKATFLLKGGESVELTPETSRDDLVKKMEYCLEVGIESLSFKFSKQ